MGERECVCECVSERVSECACACIPEGPAFPFWNCWWRAVNIRDYVLKGKGVELQCVCVCVCV